ncbi:hypothetical protein CCAX7_39980 [Capsulimonas corticalis]|uniref:Uncharacterized protein n=1 Tax=Capsulimonas corticalis TaxID=2219043 RepID=A0A402D4Z1_9BACT|nr:hypothetical protein [Capsulimonas corticalis]BDI31947.1 hypothetical protein CCAX7_39980 [Capsulimonas corticalis]
MKKSLVSPPSIAALAWTLALAAGPIWAASASDVTVRLGKTVTSPFMGLGVQWDRFYYTPTPAAWNMIVRRMDYCRPGYLRVMVGTGDYCVGFDAQGKPKYIWTEGTAAQKADFKNLTDILDYAQSRGVPVILGEWSPPKKELMAEETDPRWPQVMADFVSYLRDKRGYSTITFFNCINEPNGDWSGNKDYATWLSVVRSLRREFDARGLNASVRIIGPDTTGNTQWLEPFTWIDRATKDAPDTFGAWDLHWYALDSEVLDGSMEKLLAEKREVIAKNDPDGLSKPRFLGESGLITGRVNGDQQPRVRAYEYGVMMADYVAQVARAGWQGALAWDMDDAMHLVSWDRRPDPPDALTMKLWGFWNSQGSRMTPPEDESPRPWFYTWSLMSRLFPRGSRIVETTSPAIARFRAVAATIQRSGRTDVSVMLVNNDAISRTMTVKVPDLKQSPTLTCYRYFETDRPEDDRRFPKAASLLKKVDLRKGCTVMLPSRGVVFLTTMIDRQKNQSP